MWVRGLKLYIVHDYECIKSSHPVWVRGLKPSFVVQQSKSSKSHPVWVRGLKPTSQFGAVSTVQVAPRVGAWIETNEFSYRKARASVAPRVGAWIETPGNTAALRRKTSHPVWVRGLKQIRAQGYCNCVMSHPVWVRGLKHNVTNLIVTLTKVAPRVGAWIETVCVLCTKRGIFVAPRVGAWIET